LAAFFTSYGDHFTASQAGGNIVINGDASFNMASSEYTAGTGGAGTAGTGSLFGTTPGNEIVTAPSVNSTSDSLNAISSINAAVAALGRVQGVVGAGENTLGAVSLAQSQIATFSSAESRIRDADIAAEAADLTQTVFRHASPRLRCCLVRQPYPAPDQPPC
jgi:flagellin-like hook-associated protein FlgL